MHGHLLMLCRISGADREGFVEIPREIVAAARVSTFFGASFACEGSLSCEKESTKKTAQVGELRSFAKQSVMKILILRSRNDSENHCRGYRKGILYNGLGCVVQKSGSCTVWRKTYVFPSHAQHICAAVHYSPLKIPLKYDILKQKTSGGYYVKL